MYEIILLRLLYDSLNLLENGDIILSDNGLIELEKHYLISSNEQN
jgi:hypothetical protein